MTKVGEGSFDRVAEHGEGHEGNVDEFDRAEGEVADDDPDLLAALRPASDEILERQKGDEGVAVGLVGVDPRRRSGWDDPWSREDETDRNDEGGATRQGPPR